MCLIVSSIIELVYLMILCFRKKKITQDNQINMAQNSLKRVLTSID
jgi:hypothetical protein